MPLLSIITPVLKSLLYITLLIMVLTCPATQYPINIASILGIWTSNCLIPSTEAELMVGCRCTRKGCYLLLLRAFPKKILILAHYMLSAWWLKLLGGMVNYVILSGLFE